MSKYTTEVRYICETLSGLSESVGGSSIDTVIESSYDKIFTSSVAFWNDDYKKPLLCKVLKHYYTREIGAETFSLWRFWMNRKLEEILPSFNQMYTIAESELGLFGDVDITISHSGEGTSADNRNKSTADSYTKTGTENENVNGSSNTSTSEANYRLYSDTPQGALTGVESETYLTDATKTTDSSSGTRSNSSSSSGSSTETNSGKGTETESTTGNTTESFLERRYGKQGGASYAELMEKFQNFLNIDMLFVDAFKDLFMNIW